MKFQPRQLRSDQSTQVSVGGAVSDQRFCAGLTLRSPAGRVGRWLQWQVAPLGDGLSPSIHPIETDTQRFETATAHTVRVDLDENLESYVWRARVRYDPVDSPFVPWSRWITMTDNGAYETDLITSGAAPCDTLALEPFVSTVNRGGAGRPVLTVQDPNPSRSPGRVCL